MASPPGYQSPLSPPSQSFPPPSKKRHAPSNSTSSGRPAKKRNTSTQLSSTHPLRQTSFPPPESLSFPVSRNASNSPGTIARSGSVSSFGAAGTSRRGRKSGNAGASKAEKESSAILDVDGGASMKEGGTDSRNGRDDEAQEDDEEDEDVGAAVDALLEGGKMDEASQKQENRQLNMLLQQMDADQNSRYENWRRMKLRKETLRRIVNQTLSQSVPPSVITTINGYTKVFIGELIERARDVQEEWIAASIELPTSEKNTFSSRSRKDAENDVAERDKGPLLPDHLREALRRIKQDKEGGTTGFQGISLAGIENVACRNNGRRRLFA